MQLKDKLTSFLILTLRLAKTKKCVKDLATTDLKIDQVSLRISKNKQGVMAAKDISWMGIGADVLFFIQEIVDDCHKNNKLNCNTNYEFCSTRIMT